MTPEEAAARLLYIRDHEPEKWKAMGRAYFRELFELAERLEKSS